MSQNEHMQCLKEHTIQGWPENRYQIPQDMRTYWKFQDYMTVIDGVILKGIIAKTLHVNYMPIKLLA